ncbi:hypothetical protein BJ912DRAFT_1048738 [Pholiota molesta]|nr:hypothetical protein BJ912DRAFT_1048738 [Pholiota molesta]
MMMATAEKMRGRCEAGMLVVALGRGQGAGRRRVSDGGWQKRRATHLRDLPLVGSSLNSSSPGIHHYGGRILMGVCEWRGAKGAVEEHRQHPTSPLPTYPPSCSRQHPQHLCSITTSVHDIEGHGLMGVGIGREDPSSGQYANKYDAEHDKDNGGSVIGGASTMEMMTTATSAGHPGA